ncbi:endonuclease/exonuclease/phosphatase [Duganella sp. Leaf126]|uniref:ExeM/NucH family extracellular endonuclease n=1 Tax=Duganella sp. Leaf126 TaxID=1736266 RepID=UPI00070148F1|nr:ExeM/NucH family extracellular endonuclease [Duganella sp. Leaf126]KQQ46332.1 endonuclease/exonuclease/phosphatase [Duganella sp. Leaf126]
MNPFSTAPAQPGSRTLIAAALLAALSAQARADAPVVISQVYGGGGNSGATYKNDFIEIFNRSSAAVDISGWSVQYASAAGSSWSVTRVPANTAVLEPGQYFLFQQAAGSGGSTELPTPYVSGTLAMSGSAGKVALVSNGTALSGASPSSGALVDLFGYNASGFEGAAGPGLSNTTAALRANGGCTDTDNNASDFTTGAPNPRTTASPRQQCGVPAQPPIVPACPANLALAVGLGGTAGLSASDADGVVNAATITAGAAGGIALTDFQAAPATGGTATVNLTVAASLAAGNYPVTIRFDNDQSQQAVCTVNVQIAAAAGVTRTIPQIQGSGAASPVAGTVQTTEGVVTAKVGSGFFIQDEVGDGDPQTSDGLFVYTTAANTGTVQVGDRIRITGTVTDYAPAAGGQPYTELTNVTAIVGLAKNIVIAPTNIELPYADLTQVEGMLVRFNNALTVSQLQYLADRGEVTLSSGRLEAPTNRYRPGTPEAVALAAANARNQIILDDGIFTTPTVIPYLGADGSLRAGDTVSGLTGVVDFGAKGGGGAGFKLQPTVAPVFSQDNPRTAPPALASGNVKVASANVLNYFTTFTNGGNALGQTGQGCSIGGGAPSRSNCRGADNLLEFQRQTAKIVGELKALDADVVGLMEIQNDGDYTVSQLVEALNAAIAPGTRTYAVVPKPVTTGTDAIRVAMIYKPAALTLQGQALTDSDAINNRPPMAQTFVAPNGARFTVVVNHLKSKGSCPSASSADGDKGDGQSCWTATRVKQAQRLVGTFVPQVVAAAGDPKVLLIGDFNAYGHEDPIQAITSQGFVNQLERFVRGAGVMPYSFVFNGEAGYLDHALASAALSAQVADAAEWHNNADEPVAVDYNLDGKPQDKYTSAPYRASDHDPVLLRLNLAGPPADISASVRTANSGLVFSRASNKWSGTVSITNTAATALTGPLQIALKGLPAGVTLSNASGTQAGAAGSTPYITAPVDTLAPGATVTVPVSFTRTGSAAITYTTTVYSGTF